MEVGPEILTLPKSGLKKKNIILYAKFEIHTQSLEDIEGVPVFCPSLFIVSCFNS